MTEADLRKKVVSTAERYLGYKESDGSHKKIIDLYNAHKPLARGYRVKYTDAWCSTYASAVAIAAELTDIIPTECGCEAHIMLFKKLGIWVENDAYVPAPGDYIFYDWDDSGNGDNTGYSDHVGIVVSVTGSTIRVIEGNMSNSVGYRNIAVNSKGIRGYGVPKYAIKAASMGATAPAKPAPAKADFKVGCTVNFTGSKHYSAANTTIGAACKPGIAKVTAIAKNAKHPYHLINVSGGGSTVYGWVDAADVSAVASTPEKIHVVGKGDTLWGIAVKHLGDGTRYKEIMTYNGMKSEIIRVGQRIKIPN